MAPHNRQANDFGMQKKIQVSFVIRDEEEKYHRLGVNSLQYDDNLGHLYSAGRDSVIRIWNVHRLKDPYVKSMEHHTDWVNDIVLCCGGKHLISVSCDTTVKIWNAQKAFCMSTLRTHTDYVKAIAYAKDRERVATAGFDRSIFLFDVNTLTTLTASNKTVKTCSLSDNKGSIYSLAMSPPGNIIVSGSTENVLRVWDPRTCQKLMKLKGHTDTVKALVINADGTQCLSGSSDGTIRLWSLGQQRCITTIRVHEKGVWTLQANESFTDVYSGGNDKKIFKIELRNVDNKYLIAEESAPVTKMILTPDSSSLWVATTNSSIKNWPICNRNPRIEDCDTETMLPLNQQPDHVIRGNPGIKHYEVLNDKRHILTKDTDNNVQLYDVLKASKVKDLGGDFEVDEVKKNFKLLYVPDWFTVDLKTGLPYINLNESNSFAAWVYLKDLDLRNKRPDEKVNLGVLLLRALLEHWPATYSNEEEPENKTMEDGTVNNEKQRSGNSYFSLPEHIPVIFSEFEGRNLLRLRIGDAGEEVVQSRLSQAVPAWVTDLVVSKNMPKFNKMAFYLVPDPEQMTGKKLLKKVQLSAIDILKVGKVVEHVFEKIMADELDAGSQKSSQSGGSADQDEKEPEKERISIAEDKVELLCQNQVLDPNMDLRTVQHLFWKSSDNLVLHYRTFK